MMKRKELRQALRYFFVRPTKRWEYICWVWDRAIVLSMGTMLGTVAILKDNVTGLIGIILVIAFILWLVYATAHGK